MNLDRAVRNAVNAEVDNDFRDTNKMYRAACSLGKDYNQKYPDIDNVHIRRALLVLAAENGHT